MLRWLWLWPLWTCRSLAPALLRRSPSPISALSQPSGMLHRRFNVKVVRRRACLQIYSLLIRISLWSCDLHYKKTDAGSFPHRSQRLPALLQQCDQRTVAIYGVMLAACGKAVVEWDLMDYGCLKAALGAVGWMNTKTSPYLFLL